MKFPEGVGIEIRNADAALRREQRLLELSSPTEYSNGFFKEYRSKAGFAVVWHCADKDCLSPGYEIRVINPKGEIVAKTAFKHGEEAEALKKYEAELEKINTYDSFQPPKKK